VGIVKQHDPLHAAIQKEAHNLLRGQFVADRPSVAIEPVPYPVEQRIGKDVHVGVDDRGQLSGHERLLGIVEPDERRTEITVGPTGPLAALPFAHAAEVYQSAMLSLDPIPRPVPVPVLTLTLALLRARACGLKNLSACCASHFRTMPQRPPLCG